MILTTEELDKRLNQWYDSLPRAITVTLTEKEFDALHELSASQDILPERVMIQGLRLYQALCMGGATIKWMNNGKRKAATDAEHPDVDEWEEKT